MTDKQEGHGQIQHVPDGHVTIRGQCVFDEAFQHEGMLGGIAPTTHHVMMLLHCSHDISCGDIVALLQGQIIMVKVLQSM